MNTPETQSGSSLDLLGSAATWKRLAMQLSEEAQVVLNNAHWEVSYGSGDLRRTIKAVKRLQYTENQTPQNARGQAQPPRATEADRKNV